MCRLRSLHRLDNPGEVATAVVAVAVYLPRTRFPSPESSTCPSQSLYRTSRTDRNHCSHYLAFLLTGMWYPRSSSRCHNRLSGICPRTFQRQRCTAGAALPRGRSDPPSRGGSPRSFLGPVDRRCGPKLCRPPAGSARTVPTADRIASVEPPSWPSRRRRRVRWYLRGACCPAT